MISFEPACNLRTAARCSALSHPGEASLRLGGEGAVTAVAPAAKSFGFPLLHKVAVHEHADSVFMVQYAAPSSALTPHGEEAALAAVSNHEAPNGFGGNAIGLRWPGRVEWPLT